MSIPKCYRWGCNNPGVEKYTQVNSVSHLTPVCPEHQYRPLATERFEDLDTMECAQLTDEEIDMYKRAGDFPEEVIQEQVETCRMIVNENAPSLVPKKAAGKDLRNKILDVMLNADTCLTDEEVVNISLRTVQVFLAKYVELRGEKVGTKRGQKTSVGMA